LKTVSQTKVDRLVVKATMAKRKQQNQRRAKRSTKTGSKLGKKKMRVTCEYRALVTVLVLNLAKTFRPGKFAWGARGG